MGRRPNPARRPELLDAIVDHLIDNGLADISLRPLADALGTSTFTLTYHFGDKQGLINAALDHAESRQEELVRQLVRRGDPAAAFPEVVRGFWAWLSSPEGLGPMKLAFEASTLAIRDPDAFGDHATRLFTSWVELTQRALEYAGVDRATARAHGTIVTATITGLLLDLLVTGDRRRINAAAKAYLASLERMEVLV
jgi:AcrR family transcriptional regulator